MRILFYTWDEFTFQDACDAFLAMGHEVTRAYYEWKNITNDPGFEEQLISLLAGKNEDGTPAFDFVFSFNFFPIVSKACETCRVLYISLVFDSPFLPLTNVHINNPHNHIYTFDRRQAEQMREGGCRTIHYSPLGVDCARVEKQTAELYALPYEHDITFLGSLYNNEYSFYEQITTLPQHLKGYFDGVISAQEHVYGYDLIGEEAVLPERMIDEMHRYVRFDRTDQYRMDENVVLRDLIRRKVTENERPQILARLSRLAPVSLYTNPDQKAPEGVRNLGYASYREEMPRIFNRSKINLNITMRTIISGIPLRVTDVLAAGGFLITTYQEEIAAQFKDGEELVIAYTPDDLVEKCAYYLAHDEERERIAAAGRRKVLATYDYKDILSKILDESIYTDNHKTEN